MALGFSFGKKSQKQNSTVTVDKTDALSQKGSSTQNQTTNSLSSTNTAGQSQTNTNTATSNVGSSNMSGTTTGQQAQTTRSFSDNILGGLESLVGNALGSATTTSTPTGNFDGDAFVRDAMAAADSRTQSGLDETLNGMFDTIGGRNNSAAMLLGNRVRNDATASLAGTRANLEAQAQGITRENAVAGANINSAGQGFLTSLLGALRGGVTTTTGTSAETTAQNQNTANQSTTVGSENTVNSTNSTTQSQENMMSQLQQLLDSITKTNGTENTKGTIKSSGGGVSASM